MRNEVGDLWYVWPFLGSLSAVALLMILRILRSVLNPTEFVNAIAQYPALNVS